MNKAICDAYYKGFEECKRKVVQAFHLPDLKDIIVDKPEGIEEKGVTTVQGDTAEADESTEPKVNPAPP